MILRKFIYSMNNICVFVHYILFRQAYDSGHVKYKLRNKRETHLMWRRIIVPTVDQSMYISQRIHVIYLECCVGFPINADGMCQRNVRTLAVVTRISYHTLTRDATINVFGTRAVILTGMIGAFYQSYCQ